MRETVCFQRLRSAVVLSASLLLTVRVGFRTVLEFAIKDHIISLGSNGYLVEMARS